MTRTKLPILISLLAVAALAGCSMQADGEAAAELDRLSAELAELQAREAIRELFVDYGRTLDERDFTAFGRLFAADAEFVGGGTAHGPDDIAAMLDRAITQNASGANLHMFTNEKITVAAGGDAATAISRGAFVGQDAAGSPTALIWATYIDELVRTESGWKFQRREIVGDIPGPENGTR